MGELEPLLLVVGFLCSDGEALRGAAGPVGPTDAEVAGRLRLRPVNTDAFPAIGTRPRVTSLWFISAGFCLPRSLSLFKFHSSHVADFESSLLTRYSRGKRKLSKTQSNPVCVCACVR